MIAELAARTRERSNRWAKNLIQVHESTYEAGVLGALLGEIVSPDGCKGQR